MKQGWEIKKLGEVATYINGFAFKPEQWTDNGIPIIRIQNLNNPSAPYNYCDFEVPPKYLVEQGDILISWSASLGVYEWNNDNGYLNQHIFKVVFDKGNINKYYFKYAVASKLNIMLENLHGATMKHIVKKDFDNTLIPVPPLPEQEKIVSELDCLSDIIEKKRQQLKELDALAQSIFYEMFGNPVDNERGWEVKKLGEVCETTSGGTPSKTHNEYYEDGNIPWLRSGEVNKMFINETELYITEQGLRNSSAKWIPIDSVVIAMYGATVGQVGILKKEMTTNQAICSVFPNKTFLPIYLYAFLQNMKEEFIKMASGGAQPNISQAIIKNTKVLCPPLTLQQSFAQKIESIEKQKELIKQSIAEVETLFNSRMDYYFN
jgi:type I restriction enzyme S subunit